MQKPNPNEEGASSLRHIGRQLLHTIAFILVMCFLLAGAWSPSAAQGQEPVIESELLRLWPEYDDPGVLVISSGTFNTDLAYPFDAAFPVPEEARSIQATVDDPSQGLLNRPWELKDGRLTYSLPIPGFHYEYYVDRPPTGDQRTINYTFEAPYRMKELEVAVQQPARSTDFSVSPAPTGSFVGGDGFTYYTFTRENLAPGDRFDIVLRYTKTDENLSTVGTAPAAAASISQAPAPTPQSSVPDWVAWALIVAGAVGLLGGIGYWFYTQRKAAVTVPSKPIASAPPRMPAPRPSPPRTPGAATVFCTQCGRQLAAEDRFCASCGAPRRVSN